MMGGQEYRSHTIATEIPEDVADGLPPGEERDMLERIAGTVQHTAQWSPAEPVTAAGVELLPARLQVQVTTRTGHPDGSGVNSFVLRFALSAETLELLPEAGMEVIFDPSGPGDDDWWLLTDGSLVITSAAVLAPDVLQLEGNFEGVLTHNAERNAEEPEGSTMEISAMFTLKHVAGTDPAAAPLPTD